MTDKEMEEMRGHRVAFEDGKTVFEVRVKDAFIRGDCIEVFSTDEQAWVFPLNVKYTIVG